MSYLSCSTVRCNNKQEKEILISNVLRMPRLYNTVPSSNNNTTCDRRVSHFHSSDERGVT